MLGEKKGSPAYDITKSAYENLTERQRRFVDAFVTTRNAKDSCRQAGYGGGYAARLMNSPQIQAAIKERTPDTDPDIRDEVANFLLKVLRYEIDPKKVRFGDQLKAADQLARMYGFYLAPMPQVAPESAAAKDIKSQLDELLKPTPFQVIPGGAAATQHTDN
jgi:hypothetical protein